MKPEYNPESCFPHLSLRSRLVVLLSHLCEENSMKCSLLVPPRTAGWFNSATIQKLIMAALIAVFIFGCATLPVAAQTKTNPKHFFWAKGQPSTPNPNSLANDLIYHGGNAGSGAIGIEKKPATYLIFWGPDWANGFTTTDNNGVVFTSQQLQNYVTSTPLRSEEHTSELQSPCNL